MMMIKWLLIYSTICIQNIYAGIPNKLIGGEKVHIKYHNYMVSVQWNSHHLCNGNIISQYHILTTASCVIFDKSAFVIMPSNIKVISGTKDRTNQNSINNVKYIIYHQNYDALLFWSNDIAILILEEKLRYSEKCGQIRVRSKPLNGQSVIETVGWGGNIDGDVEPSKYLRILHLKTVNQEECSKIYPGHPPFERNKRCALSLKENTGFARGDGGGPIIHYGQIAGLISVMDPMKKNFVIFTSTYHYLDWIYILMEKNLEFI